jgi:hypothetical protein
MSEKTVAELESMVNEIDLDATALCRDITQRTENLLAEMARVSVSGKPLDVPTIDCHFSKYNTMITCKMVLEDPETYIHRIPKKDADTLAPAVVEYLDSLDDIMMIQKNLLKLQEEAYKALLATTRYTQVREPSRIAMVYIIFPESDAATSMVANLAAGTHSMQRVMYDIEPADLDDPEKVASLAQKAEKRNAGMYIVRVASNKLPQGILLEHIMKELSDQYFAEMCKQEAGPELSDDGQPVQ